MPKNRSERRSAPRPGSATHGYKSSEYETTAQVDGRFLYVFGVGWAWVLEAADVPFLDAGWVEIVEEATGNLEGVAGVSFGPEFWVAEIQLVHGSGDAHVKQATFLLEAFGTAFVDDAGVGEHAFGEPDEEDDFPFQAFGLVDAGQGHGIVIGLLFASALGPIAGAGIVGVGE